MRLATKRTGRALSFALVAVAAGCIALAAGVAQAQPNTPPGVDHYLVYPVLNPPTLIVPLILSDQFIQNAQYETAQLEFFMTPVSKNNEVLLDTLAHYTWWRTTTYPFGARAVITNQFDPAQVFDIFQPRYLLNPALKSLPPFPPRTGPLPVKNHYEAYDVTGNPIGLPVSLLDQFFHLEAMVNFPRFLATPVEKILPSSGQAYPILDPVGHLAIYDITVIAPLPPPQPGPVFAVDQFGTWQLELGPPIWLCVPSYKTGVVGTKASSWGRLKSLYR